MSLEAAKQSTRFFISRTRSQADILTSKRYPGDHQGPLLWLRIVKGVLDTADAYLDLTKVTTPKDQADSVRDAGRLAMLAYRNLNLINGTSTDDLPFPVVFPLDRWFSAVGLNNSTIFRAELVANYEIRTIDRDHFDRIRNRAKSLDDALNAVIWPLTRITVPAKALGMLPHFAIVAHEIGHSLYNKVNWDFTKYQSEMVMLISAIESQLSSSPLKPSVSLFLSSVFVDWVQEIAADAFGYLMAGPSFFFALCGFLETAGAGLGISDTHPANELRRNQLYSRISTGKPSFASLFKSELGITLDKDINSQLLPPMPPKPDLLSNLSSRSPYQADVSSKEQAVVLVELNDFLKLISDDIFSQAEAYLRSIDKNLVYTPAQFKLDVRMHADALVQAIPPIETDGALDARVQVDFATILNVGWAVLLAKLDQLAVKSDPKSDIVVDKTEKLHSLLLKAVELSEARRMWEKIQ